MKIPKIHPNGSRNHSESVLLAASRPKGTVDCVVGDRGRIVFNAARPCAEHRAAAALAALHASSARRADGELVSEKGIGAVAACACAFGADACEISVGAASGGAVVGNVGAEELRCFNVLSTLCSWAAALERLSAQGLGAALADDAVAELADGVLLRAVPRVVRHWKHHPDAAARVWAVEGVLEQAAADQDEWMYQRERALQSSPFYALNQAVDAY
eukprot:gene13004-biopygen12481